MTAMLDVGARAPDFDLPTETGSITLAGFADKNVVLYFYPKDDTSGCTQEAIDFNCLRAAFETANTEIIGISPDSLKSHARFRTKHGLELTLASDEGKSMLESYSIWVQKSMYGRKYMGVERTTILLDSRGKIARVWKNVKVAGHAEEVLRIAQTL